MKQIKLKIALFANGDPLPLSSRAKAVLKRKKLVSRVLTIAAALFILMLLVKTLVGDRGFLSVLKIRSQYSLLYDEVQQREKRNARLVEEVNRLKSDEYYKEKLAREKLGFMKEGEIVFLFPSNHEEKKGFPDVNENGFSENAMKQSPKKE